MRKELPQNVYLYVGATEFSAACRLIGESPAGVLFAEFPYARKVTSLAGLKYPCLVISDAFPLLTEDGVVFLLSCGRGKAVAPGFCLAEREEDLHPRFLTAGQNRLSPATYGEIVRCLRKRKNRALASSGVWIEDPERTDVGVFCCVEPGCEILSGSRITGRSKIGKNTVLCGGNLIKDAVIGKNCVITSSVLTDCVIGDGCVVGPNAHLRPGTLIGDNCKVGAFTELKHARLGEEVKVPHLSYLGDCTLGDRTNVGCGIVTANYDGKNKWETTVGADVFLGCNSVLVAPVGVEDGAYIAAGTVVTADVPKDGFAIGRVRQTVREKPAAVQKNRD